jgi:hypothetical protein
MRKRSVVILTTLIIAAIGSSIGANIFKDHVKDRVLYTGSYDPDSYAQQKERFQTVVYKEGPAEALAKLEKESSDDPKTLALCHDLLHGIGGAAYEKTSSVGSALSFNNSFCNSGYIHGVFESYFVRAQPTTEDLASLCSPFMQESHFEQWQCLHGMGHGFMYLTDGDLDKSLELCSEILQEGEKTACQNGVFMEIFNAEILPNEQDLIDPHDPFAICDTRDPKDICYAYVPIFLSQTKDLAFYDIFHECEKAGEQYEGTCVHGVGSEAMKRNMNDPSAVFKLCGYAGSFSKAEECVQGMVGMYMNQKGSYTAGKSLCEEVPFLYRDTCLIHVESRELFFRDL